jgi:hypothetical protein
MKVSFNTEHFEVKKRGCGKVGKATRRQGEKERRKAEKKGEFKLKRVLGFGRSFGLRRG